MKLVLISDTHEQHDKLGKLPDGDVLIHAGDYTYTGKHFAKQQFFTWLHNQPHKHKIHIAGNHDFGEPKEGISMEGAHYLYDSGVEIDGVKFWGSPWTPRFGQWAFMYPPAENRWGMIPDGTDVLITHGPAEGILDRPFGNRDSAGCRHLTERVYAIKPKVHVFGHIHGSHGYCPENGTEFFNASVVNEDYAGVNKPWEVEL